MICPRSLIRPAVVVVCALGPLIAVSSSEIQGQGAATLRIGASSSLTPADWTVAQEKAALQSLRSLIKEQTGLENEIFHEKDWRVLVSNLEKGRQQLGVFPGYEFAWAEAKCAKLKPLALAVNGLRYPVVSLVTHSNSNARNFSGVQGRSLALPPSGQNLARRFVDRETKAAGKKPEAYFSRIVSADNAEEALDGVVDGLVQAAAVERIGLQAYQRRKPGRFKHLKEIARSQPFPPVVVAYYDKSVDARTLQRFRAGLVGANRRQKGQVLLTLFRLTGFEEVPRDLGQVLIESRKAFPPGDGRE